jgi:hypothetical protein
MPRRQHTQRYDKSDFIWSEVRLPPSPLSSAGLFRWKPPALMHRPQNAPEGEGLRHVNEILKTLGDFVRLHLVEAPQAIHPCVFC